MADLGFILAAGLLLGGLIWAGETLRQPAPIIEAVRVPLALAFVLFVPGYLLQAALFPRWGDLKTVERVGLSIGLSVALVPLLALLLDRLPWGLRPVPIVAGQGLLVLALMLAAAWRRWQVGAEASATPEAPWRPREWWRGMEKADRWLYLFAGGALLLAALVVGWVFLVPAAGEFTTEFYLLGKGGMAEEYPYRAGAGEPVTTTVGIHNREREARTYRAEVWAVDPAEEDKRALVADGEPVLLGRGERRELPLTWLMPEAGDDQQIEILLYIDDEPEPYRRLLLWLDVGE
jgi:uncharacterized membrane protein